MLSDVFGIGSSVSTISSTAEQIANTREVGSQRLFYLLKGILRPFAKFRSPAGHQSGILEIQRRLDGVVRLRHVCMNRDMGDHFKDRSFYSVNLFTRDGEF